MTTQHTQGQVQAGVSLFQGREVFTAVPTDNQQKIVAMFGFCGADDEAESIANLRRFVACWNKFYGASTLTIESMTKPVHEVLFYAGARMSAAEAQRDELLAALNLLKAADFGANVKTTDDEKHMDSVAAFARAAIAKAEGGAA